MSDIITQIRKRIQEPLPGIDVQYQMAPFTREKIDISKDTPKDAISSAVLLLIYKQNDSLFIPLTKRQEYPGKHSGQISFPGGKFEPEDIVTSFTAQRETKEELGFNYDIDIIGSLTPLYIPVSSFIVEPFIGLIEEDNPRFNPDSREVAEMIPLNLESLRNNEVQVLSKIIEVRDYKIKAPYFDIKGEVVWGATAMILNEFKALIA